MNKKYLIDYFKINQFGGYNFNKLNFDEVDGYKLPLISDRSTFNFITPFGFELKIKNNAISMYQGNLHQSKFNLVNFENDFGYLVETIKILEKKYQNNENLSFLMLGFGIGGGVLKLLNSKILNISNIDCIDINGNLFNVFKGIINSSSGVRDKSINLNNLKKINFIKGDAIKYLDYCSKNNIKYDIIIDDIFTDKKINYDYNILNNVLKNKNYNFFINVHEDVKNYFYNLKKYFPNLKFLKNNEYLIYAV